MAKKQEEEPRAVKKRREVPAKVVESEESDDGVMGDEFEGLSEDVESEEEEEEGFESESEEEEEMGEGARGLMGRIVQSASGRALLRNEEAVSSDVDSMEGSRSRSEEDLRDIGSARRLDDDDTGDSAWKEAVAEAGVVDWDASGNPGPSSSSAPDAVAVKEKSGETASGSGGDVALARGLDDGENGGEGADAMETDDEDEDEDEDEDAGSSEAESQSEGEPSASVSLEGGSDCDTGSGGKGDKGDSTQSSAYSRAFSKILQQSKAAKESDTGPVLAARQTLVARKLEEEAGDAKEKKDTKKEKKELREKAHLYPQSFTDTKEKDLVKLATRGVVKLFNAVSKAQKVQASADGRDAKEVAKQSKSAFLAEVRGTGTSAAVGSKRSLSSASTPPFKFGTSESQNQSTSRWSVVKDDFMLGKQKLKDWDKDEEMGDAAGVQQLNNRIDDDSD